MEMIEKWKNKIWNLGKSIFDLINNEKLKTNLFNALPFWIGAFVSGTVAVLYAGLFSLAENGTRWVYNQEPWLFLAITPLGFVLAWWLVHKYAPYAKGSGIPQVIASIELSTPKHKHLVSSLLSLRILVVKVFSSLIMVFSGGVIGREGPTIQISASIFKKINDMLPEWYPKISKRNMVVTGAAAGLAAAFNTPLGGIVFAIEELTKTHISFFRSALLTGVIISGFTALHFLGPYLYLGYPDLSGISFQIVFLIIPLSLITGIAGSGMGKIILWILKKKIALKTNSRYIFYVVVCGLIIAGLGIFLDDKIFGSGKEIMVSTLFTDNKQLEWYVPIMRIFGSIISFSTGASGGIFAPSLSAGAALGAFFAEGFHLTANETNLIVLCGMTGFLTSITRSPFTSSILVLEMTVTHEVIFYIMLAALFSSLVATLISKHSFYDELKNQYLHEILQEELNPSIKNKYD